MMSRPRESRAVKVTCSLSLSLSLSHYYERPVTPAQNEAQKVRLSVRTSVNGFADNRVTYCSL